MYKTIYATFIEVLFGLHGFEVVLEISKIPESWPRTWPIGKCIIIIITTITKRLPFVILLLETRSLIELEMFK